MQKLARHIRQLRAELYQSFPRHIRAIHAITRIASHSRRRKKAYRQSEITRLIDSEMKRQGILADLREEGHTVPNIDWGKLYKVALSQMRHTMNLDDDTQEQMLAYVIEEDVLGKGLQRIRNTKGPTSNIMEAIADWVRQGWSEKRIKATLTNHVKKKLQNEYIRYQRRMKDQGAGDVGFSPGGPPSEGYQGGEMFEDLFTMDGLSGSQLAGYHSMLRKNPVVKDLVEKMDKTLSRRDDDLGLIWRAYTKFPSATSIELLDVEVRHKGRKMPLYEALGIDPNKTNLQKRGLMKYRIDKLQKLLQRLWPGIEDVLHDMLAD